MNVSKHHYDCSRNSFLMYLCRLAYPCLLYTSTNMIANMSTEGKHISMDTLARICETPVSYTHLSMSLSR